MHHSNITAKVQFRITVFKMENTISQKKNMKASAANTIAGKPPPGDKTLGIEPAIRLYKIDDCDNTE